MSDDLTSPLKAADLRQLCRQRGLSVSGKKSVLVERLLEADVDPVELGLEFLDSDESQLKSIEDEEALILDSEEEAPRVSKEDSSKAKATAKAKENTTTTAKATAKAKENTTAAAKAKGKENTEKVVFEAEIIDAEVVDAEVVDAEVFEADLIDEEVLGAEIIEADVIDDKPRGSTETPESSEPLGSVATEKTQVALPPIPAEFRKESEKVSTKPRTAIILVAIILVGGVGYWYYSGNIEPFTPDSIRYGDEMRYSISEGVVSAEGEFVETIVESMDTDDDICKLKIEYSGMGTVGVTKGGQSELYDQTNDYLLGAVRQSGSFGFEWLTVERQHQYDFDDVSITRHLRSVIDQSKCSDIGASSFGNSLDMTSSTWTEVRDQDVLRSQVDYTLNHESGVLEGTATTFGISGIFSSVSNIQSAIAMAVSPVELKELIGDQLIQESSTGSRMGWTWSVLGTEEISGEVTWRILMVNDDVKSLCLGHAYINIWVNANSPWAIRQEVDIRLSGDSQDRNECSTTSQIINDLVVPEGSLELRMTMSKKELQRGETPVVFGRDYDNRVRSSQVRPLDSELTNWQDGEQHIADNSTSRPHPLESAVACIPHLDGASGAKAAMSGDGYIWMAIENHSNPASTYWNLSWVDSGDTSGWVELSVSGTPNSDNCSFINSGVIEDGPKHDRASLPETLTLSAMENRLLDSDRYSELSSGAGYLGTSTSLHPEVRYRHLVASTSTGLDGLSDWLNLGDGPSAATVDFSRSWEEGQWSNRFSLAADLSDGRVIGWALTKSA